jgi:hypothetical protein
VMPGGSIYCVGLLGRADQIVEHPERERHLAAPHQYSYRARRPKATLDEPVDGRDVAFESDRRGSRQSHRWGGKRGTTERSNVKHFLARSHAR